MVGGLYKWRIDQARSHATPQGPGQMVETKPIYRTRLDRAQNDNS